MAPPLRSYCRRRWAPSMSWAPTSLKKTRSSRQAARHKVSWTSRPAWVYNRSRSRWRTLRKFRWTPRCLTKSWTLRGQPPTQLISRRLRNAQTTKYRAFCTGSTWRETKRTSTRSRSPLMRWAPASKTTATGTRTSLSDQRTCYEIILNKCY